MNEEKKIMNLNKNNFLNYSILIPYLILAGIGIVMVFSTTVPDQLQKGLNPYKLVINQTAFELLSLIMIAVIYRLKLRALKNRKMIGTIMVILILSLIFCRIMPSSFALTAPVNGARGWIHIPGIGTVQPAEFAKVFIIWYLASVFSTKQEEIEKRDINEIFKGKTLFQKLFGGWRLPVVAILLVDLIMPDLGNTLIIAAVALIMIGASGISWRWYSGYSKLILSLMAIFLGFLFIVGGNIIPSFLPITYINKRFEAFVNPFTDLANSGHQLANSYYAIVNGGWTGRGLGNSIQKNGFLPEAQTDFIFPIVVEELGIIGGIIILAILFFLISRMLIVGIRAKSAFNSLIMIGVSGLLLVQVFVNVGGAIGIIPETGVTFPFLSQGGSSFLVLSLGIAFALNISADEKRREVSELSNIMYPQVFLDYQKMQREFGAVTLLDTPTFLHGMRLNEKIEVQIEKGKTLSIRLDEIGEPDLAGNRVLFFNLNGQRREVVINDQSVQTQVVAKRKAETGNPNQIGATMPGSVLEILVKAGDKVQKGQALMVTEAMKMETTIEAPFDGEIVDLHVVKGEAIQTQDLLIEIN